MNHTALSDLAHAKCRSIVKVVSLIYNVMETEMFFFYHRL